MRWTVPAFLFYVLLPPMAGGTGTIQGKITLPEGALQKKTQLDPKYANPKLKKIKKDPDPSLPVLWLEGPPAEMAKDKTVEVRQEGLEFRPRVLAIQAGTKVRFTNMDCCQHHVCSYSKPKRFDHGYCGQGDPFEETFDKPGRIDLQCEIHSHMQGFIQVVDHPFFAVADKDGNYRIQGVPDGKYQLKVWHEDYDLVSRDVEVKGNVVTLDLKLPPE